MVKERKHLVLVGGCPLGLSCLETCFFSFVMIAEKLWQSKRQVDSVFMPRKRCACSGTQVAESQLTCVQVVINLST